MEENPAAALREFQRQAEGLITNTSVNFTALLLSLLKKVEGVALLRFVVGMERDRRLHIPANEHGGNILARGLRVVVLGLEEDAPVPVAQALQAGSASISLKWKAMYLLYAETEQLLERLMALQRGRDRERAAKRERRRWEW